MRTGVLAFTWALVSVGIAHATDTTAGHPSLEIVVEAPRVHALKDPSGRTIDTVSVTHRVSYEDLDLSTPAGAKALEQRVDDAAGAACKDIDTLYPLNDPAKSRASCEKAALDKALPQVRAAIAAAKKPGR